MNVLEEIEETLQALGASKSNLPTLRAPLRIWRLADPRPAERRTDITVTATK